MALEPVSAEVLAVKLETVKEDVTEIKKSVEEIKVVLNKLMRIEEQQSDYRHALERCFQEIKLERDKIAGILSEIPAQRAFRRWVIGGVLTAAGMLGMALFSLLVIQPLYRGYGVTVPIVVPPAITNGGGK